MLLRWHSSTLLRWPPNAGYATRGPHMQLQGPAARCVGQLGRPRRASDGQIPRSLAEERKLYAKCAWQRASGAVAAAAAKHAKWSEMGQDHGPSLNPESGPIGSVARSIGLASSRNRR